MPDSFAFPHVTSATYALSRAAGKPPTLRLTLTIDAGAQADADALIDALDHPATLDAYVALYRHENGSLVNVRTGELAGPINPDQPTLALDTRPRTEQEAAR